jgi:epoxyqueuosine reductase
VARYAWRDHYSDLAAGLEVIADELRSRGWAARVVLDDNALVDRAAAWRAGLGWYGKNANILLPEAGSWFVLGGVVTDAPLSPAGRIVPDGCGSCTRCLDGCPTGAIVAPGVIDARRCLAWLVQAPGWIPAEFREAVGDRLYGCDDCQEVCPPNRVVERRSPAPLAAQDCQPSVDLVWLLDATDAEILERLGRWYIPRRDPDHLRRNALVVLGNTADLAEPWVLRTLDRYRRHPNPMVRAHAVWASRRLGHPVPRDPDEEDPRVQAEWDHPVRLRT